MISVMSSPFGAVAASLFVAVWTAGMSALMFPAILPVVLLYNRLIRNEDPSSNLVLEDGASPWYGVKMMLFVGSYLAVWALTGLVLLLSWSIMLDAASSVLSSDSLFLIYGSILVIAGIYQFSPVKSRCLGYCESPVSLFIRRWKNGRLGAVTMGTFHGLYCLGCCWPYFLVMLALGWMDLLSMALFAGIIFAEKTWSKGIWFARAAGIGMAAAGALALFGIVEIPSSNDLAANMDEGVVTGE